MGTLLKLRPGREATKSRLRAASAASAASPASAASAASEPRSRPLVRAPEVVELRAFCTAIDLGSIGKAARYMRVSQPALSKRLQTLEAVAGTKLLERSSRGVTATATGVQLYDTALRLLESADAVETVIRGFSANPAPVRVVTSATMRDWWLPGVMVELDGKRANRLPVEVITADSSIVRQMISSGRCDIGLAAVDPDEAEVGLTETIVWSDEVIVAVPTGHPWASCEEIDPHDFAGTPVLARDPSASSSRVVARTLEQHGLTQTRPLAEIGCTAAVRATALAQSLPALLPREAVSHEPDGGLLVRRIAGIRFERQFALVLAGPLDSLAPHVREFAQHLLTRAER